MIFYIIPYIFLVFMSLLSLKIKGGGYKFLFLVGLIPATLVVILRGLTGTDTYTYLTMLNSTSYEIDENYYNVELAFLMYIRIIRFFDISPQIALNFFGLLICIFSYINFSKYKNYFIIFSSLIFPVFFYDMTMNGVRYGLAFILSVPFILELTSNVFKITRNKIYLILAILNHNSVLTFIFFKIMPHLNVRNFIFSMILASGIFYLIQDYLLLKFNDYSNSESPGVMSGLQPLILMILICILNSIFCINNFKRNFYMLFLQLFFYGITQISYAGIRFQFAVLFFMMVLLATDEIYKNYKVYLFLLYSIGFLGFMLKSRNMVDGFGIGMSPFLPYTFIGN